MTVSYFLKFFLLIAFAVYMFRLASRDPAIGKTATIAEGGLKRHSMGKIILGERTINARLDTGASAEELKAGEKVIIIEKVGESAIVKPARKA